jgi:opacity protein-like surface antigen
VAGSVGLGGGVAYDGKVYNEDGDEGQPAAHINGGGLLFFDATYAEIGIGIGGDTSTHKDNEFSTTILALSLLGKYPIALKSFTVYPALGIEGDIIIGAMYDGKAVDPDYLDYLQEYGNSFSFKVGGGLDFPIKDKLYLRSQLLWAFRLPTKGESDQFADKVTYNLGHGPTLKIGLGYKF